MSLSQKEFYFYTNRSTLFRYFVDNSSGNRIKHIFYPKKYQLMTDKQIQKYERRLSLKFIWWGIRNKQKMTPYDFNICKSHVYDAVFAVITTMLMAKLARIMLFKHQFIGLETYMEARNFDVRFWKSLVAYSIFFTIGYKRVKEVFNQPSLSDLAVQYSPNFTDELQMPQIQPLLNSLYRKRFPWLGQQINQIQKGN